MPARDRVEQAGDVARSWRRCLPTVQVLHARAGVVWRRLQLCLKEALAEDGDGMHNVQRAARHLGRKGTGASRCGETVRQ